MTLRHSHYVDECNDCWKLYLLGKEDGIQKALNKVLEIIAIHGIMVSEVRDIEERILALKKTATSHQCWDGCPCQKDDIGLVELKKKKEKELNDKHLP
jgi:hypothetical protein